MKFFDNESIFPYAWEDITKANWQKYPSEITPHVESVDILRREVDPKTGVLRTERLIGVRQQAPLWILKIMGASGNHVYCREVSEIDPRKGTLIMRSRNLDFSQVLSVFETVRYERDPIDPCNSTKFSQRATFHAGLYWKKVCCRLEEYTMQRFQQNAQLGREAIDEAIAKIISSTHRA